MAIVRKCLIVIPLLGPVVLGELAASHCESAGAQQCDASVLESPQGRMEGPEADTLRLSKDSILLQSWPWSRRSKQRRSQEWPRSQPSHAMPQQHLPLCHPTIIDDSCQKLGGSLDLPSVSWAALAGLLSADSLASAQAALGLPEDQPSIGCSELCAAVVQYVRDSGETLPPSSDVTCRTVRGNTTCDVDASPDFLLHMLDSVNLEELSDDGPVIASDENATDADADGISARLLLLSDASDSGVGRSTMLRRAAPKQDSSGAEPQDEPPAGAIKYNVWEVAERIANLFRIYPSKRQFDQPSAPGMALLQSEADILDATVAGVISTRVSQAKAWLATILREMRGRKASAARRIWFGGSGAKSEEQVRQRVLRTMNFIEEVLVKGARFIYPANRAQKTACNNGRVAAYVWSQPSSGTQYVENSGPVCKNSADPYKETCGLDQDGKYFIYLCQLFYTDAGPSTQVSLLIHEAAHHAGPTDVTYDKEQMKRVSQADQLNNAASYQNFAQQVAQSVPLAAPRVACVDLYGSCQYYKDKGFCKSPSDNIGTQCRLTCGFCTPKSDSVPAPAPPRAPAPPPPAKAGCADLYSSCQYYKDNGFCKSPSDNIGQQCQKTCGFCAPKSKPVPAPRPAPRPPTGGACADSDGACSYYASEGYCNVDHIKKSCQRSCNLCGGGRPAPAPRPSSCVDLDGACGYYESQGYCSTDHIKKNCPKSCRQC